MMSSASPVLMPREDPVGKILFAVIALAFGLVCFVALMTLLVAVLQGLTRRSTATLREAPFRALAVGVVAYGVLGSLAWYLFSGAFIKRLLETEIVPGMLWSGILVVTVLGVVTLLGATGTVSLLGERLAGLSGRPMSRLRGSVWGTLVAVLASWFPGVGWFVVAPALVLFSCGAALLGLGRRTGGPESDVTT